jgi:outer membrane protein TolC
MSGYKITLTLFLAIIFCANSALSLSLSEYIEQVKNQNLSYESANINADAYELLQEKAKLVNAITLYGYTEKGFAEQNQALQIFRYSKTYSQKNQVGFTHNSSFGLSSNLYYSLNKITYKDLNTGNLPNPGLAASNFQATPVIELSLSLWQNRLGAQNKASRDSIYFSNQSQKFTARSLSLTELIESEKIYWDMVYAKRAVEIQKQALDSAQQIFDYVSRRAKMNLGEEGDVLQAKALLESKKLLLKQAQNDERIAARNFNKQRFLNSDEVKEELENFDMKKLEKFLVPKIRDSDRLDIKASEAQFKSAVANAKLEEENNKPILNLYGSYAVNQIERNSQRAIDNSFNQVGESGKIGVNFSMPVNFGLSSDIRRGAVKNASAAKMEYRWKVFEQENDWLSLITNLSSYKDNLNLALEIEKSQKLKLENERKMLKQGRTDTYQVLLFEQDFSNSKLTTVRIAHDLLHLTSDLKLYENQPYQ